MFDWWGRVAPITSWLRGLNWAGIIAAAAFVAAMWSLSILPRETYSPQQQTGENAKRATHSQKQTNTHGSVPANQPSFVDQVVAKYAEPYSAYCARDPSQKSQEWLHKFACDVRITDVVIAAFTAVLGLFTIILAGAIFWQVIVTRRAFRRQLRAYIAVDSITREGPHQGALRIKVNLKNAGQTPAYRLKCYIDSQYVALPVAKGTVAHDFSVMKQEAVLNPGASQFASFVVDPPLTAEQLVAIQTEGAGGYLVQGCVRYRDAFGKRRHTWFKQVYVQQMMATGALIYCEDGNKAD